jgi:Uma2 family endonuclease
LVKEPILPQLDEPEYLNWEAKQTAKFELHHGFVVAFAGGTADHDTVANNVRAALKRLFEAPYRMFGSDVKLRISQESFFYPDAMVICDPVLGSATYLEAPKVVAEVLSRSTRAYDLFEKRAAYRGLVSLVAYVVVHTDMRRVEVDSRNPDGSWTTETFDEQAFINGREFTLQEVYAGTSLETEE